MHAMWRARSFQLASSLMSALDRKRTLAHLQQSSAAGPWARQHSVCVGGEKCVGSRARADPRQTCERKSGTDSKTQLPVVRRAGHGIA